MCGGGRRPGFEATVFAGRAFVEHVSEKSRGSNVSSSMGKLIAWFLMV